MIEIPVSNNEGENHKEIHLKKGTKKQTENRIQFTALLKNPNSVGYESNRIEAGQIDSGYHKVDNKWSLPFSVDDLEDFQTEFKVEGELAQSLTARKLEILSQRTVTKKQQWFSPQPSNNDCLITRVIVTENPSDYNATILVIFDEPIVEEYLIKNKTIFDIKYRKWDTQAKKPLSDWFTVFPDS
jgi:hypothetical protein